MNKPLVATAVAAGLLCSGAAGAVNLNPNGFGQVLIYPYYTVNDGQATLISVGNATNVGKVVRLLFLEGYNGREVLQFNLYLSPYDIWTADLFALRDAGVDSDYAGIFTTDNSCTDPVALTGSGSINTDGGAQGYQRFLDYAYTGAYADTGPVSDARTREGHIEMILMANIAHSSQLAAHIMHVNGVPPDCASADLRAADGYAPPTADLQSGSNTAVADGGLFGAAGIVNVADGTYYAYNADALDGFSYQSLYSAADFSGPTLESVNDRDVPLSATARLFVNGELLTATYGGPDSASRPIDAISAVFMADSVYNEFVAAANGATGTDWVMTFPTKRFYVDGQPFGAADGISTALPPFENVFSSGLSCIELGYSSAIFDRDESTIDIFPACPWECPPPPLEQGLCSDTNVVRFATTSVLGSQLPVQTLAIAPFSAGMVKLDFSGSGHDMPAASNGNVFHGLPVTGFAVTKFVNGSVALLGGGDALANYTAASRHRATANCTNGNGGCL